ncbi:hypothetical protein DRO49_05540 [Candidatus Bathyarchaeota archaeon]|nr:MAG: hypothetical protein DRO49_05540 [Candidatus Bathyarchaeota archaeon]
MDWLEGEDSVLWGDLKELYRFLRALSRMVVSEEWLWKKKVFILGSYKRECLERLERLKEEINRLGDVYAFLMSDVPDFLRNLVDKFASLALLADAIILVVEHDIGGHVLECGIIISKKEFFHKSLILVRKGVSLSLMFKEGALKPPYFKEGKNLFYFETENDIVNIAKNWLNRFFKK